MFTSMRYVGVLQLKSKGVIEIYFKKKEVNMLELYLKSYHSKRNSK